MWMLAETTQEFSWSFPGGLWGLGAAALGALGLVALSYRLAMTRAALSQRWALSFLRFFALALLLACICRPTLVRQVRSAPQDRRKVAVVFDESGSMDVKDVSGRSRRDQALWYWQRQLNRQRDRWDVQTFGFAESFRSSDKPGQPPAPQPPAAQRANQPLRTHLYRSLADWSGQLAAQGFDAVICLTDGVDTSGESRREALDALHQTAMPHAFVATAAPLPAPRSVEITKLEVASTAQVGTDVPVNMLVQLSGVARDQAVEVQVRQGERVVHARSIDAAGGSTHAVNFEVPVPSEETLIYDAELKVAGQTLTSARWSIQGLSAEKPVVLLYQGALDWGTRQLRGVFERADNAELEVRYADGAMPAVQAQPFKDNFPAGKALGRFSVVILLDIAARQVTPQMEASLTEFVRSGGGLLVLCGNPTSGSAIAASPLEKLLPVEFGPPSDSAGRMGSGPDLAAIERTLRGPQGADQVRANLVNDNAFMARQSRAAAAKLLPVTLTREGLQCPVFNFAVRDGQPIDEMLPRFETLSPILRAKSGARVLATDAQARIVLASQSFGKGRSAVLASDGLWRWKLSLDSQSYAFEKFWRQLVAYLAPGVRRAPSWLLDSAVYPPNKTVEVKFSLPDGADLTMDQLQFAAEADGQSMPLALTPAEADRVFRTTLLPKPKMTYHLLARKDGAVVAQAYLTGRADLADAELRSLRPDLAGLAELAAASRGAVVDLAQSFDWDNWLPQRPGEIVKVERKPLWHSPGIFAALLLLLLAEWLIRRRWKML